MHEATLGGLGLHRAALHFRARVLQHRPIVRVQKRFRILAQQLVDVVAERFAGGAVDADQPKLAIEQECRHRTLVEQRAKALGAFGQIGLGLLARADVAREQQNELAPVVHDSLQHGLNREFGAEARLVARIGLKRAARLQLLVQRRKPSAVVLSTRKADIDRTERQSLQRLAVVAEPLPRGIVGVDYGALPVDFEDHFADGFERLPQRPKRVLRKALAIDPLARNQHAVEAAVDREHRRQFNPHPSALSARQPVFAFDRRTVAAFTDSR